MTTNENKHLPLALRIAARTTELDNIETSTSLDKLPIRCSIYTPNIDGWADQLMNRSCKHLNKEIEQELITNPNAVFYISPDESAEVTNESSDYVAIHLRYDIR